ncbi:MAG: MATE family efflux transporter [Pseudoflavonifractor sp.]
MPERIPENKMGTMPINRLLISMSGPIMISMLVQALYNVVDSIFVARISERSLTAVSLVFPVQNIMIALAVGTGVGVNALLSKSLGERDFDRANKTADNGVFLAVITCIVFAVAGVLLAKPFMLSQTQIPEIVEAGTIYMTICCGASCGIFIEIMFERLLQSTGRTFYTMITQGVGAIFNIVFDPLLIFGIGPFPKMGVAGAALATVLGQIIGAVLAVALNHFKNPEIKLSLRKFRPDGWIIRKIYLVGLPSIIMNSIGSVMVFGLNRILLAFTDTAAAVLGVYFKVQSFAFMPIFGLNNGMVPIIAYNYGARQRSRMTKTVKLALVYAISIMTLGFLAMQLLPTQILMLFEATPDMLAIGVPALRIISLSFIPAGYCIITSTTFQALGQGVQSMAVSIVRQLVVLLPAAWLLSLAGNINVVWWAFPIAEIFSVLLCTLFYLRAYHKIIKPLDKPLKAE